jgi:mRNA interferase MazF
MHQGWHGRPQPRRQVREPPKRTNRGARPESQDHKRRPAVIVSNDAASARARRLGRGVMAVVPVTSNIERIFPFQVFPGAAVTGLDRDSKAQAEQVRSLDVGRVGARLGVVPEATMLEIDEALRLHLDL